MTKLNKYMFRKYDLRGRVDDEELNETTMEIIGRAFATYLRKRGITKCIVSHDSRSYSTKLKNALTVGLLQSGVDVIDIGLCTTPCSYFAQYHLDVRGLAMITASHNPNGWSGVKFGDGMSKTLLTEEMQELYQLADNENFSNGRGTYAKDRTVREAYISDMVGRVKLNKKLKIVINAGNAVAGIFAPEVFRRLGCEVIEQFCNLDNTFPNHEPDPENNKAKEFLMQKVKETDADLGIGYDGDGDRLGIVDNKGRNIWSDKVLIFLARQVVEKKPNSKIVFDVKCTQLLPDDIQKNGGVPIMWKTGHSFIKQKCKEESAALAGERSGHIFFVDNWYGFDDGIYASLRLVEYLSNQEKSMSELIDELPGIVSSPTHHTECGDDVKWDVVSRVVDDLKKQGHKLIDIDGARVCFDNGFGLVRASSNLPQLVLVFEADTQENLNKYKAVFKDVLSKYPEVSQDWSNE